MPQKHRTQLRRQAVKARQAEQRRQQKSTSTAGMDSERRPPSPQDTSEEATQLDGRQRRPSQTEKTVEPSQKYQGSVHDRRHTEHEQEEEKEDSSSYCVAELSEKIQQLEEAEVAGPEEKRATKENVFEEEEEETKNKKEEEKKEKKKKEDKEKEKQKEEKKKEEKEEKKKEEKKKEEDTVQTSPTEEDFNKLNQYLLKTVTSLETNENYSKFVNQLVMDLAAKLELQSIIQLNNVIANRLREAKEEKKAKKKEKKNKAFAKMVVGSVYDVYCDDVWYD